MRQLSLEVVEFSDDAHFRWRLSDEDGAYLADHEVSLDTAAPEYGGYVDLHGLARWNAGPDSTMEDEQLLVERIAAWVRSQVWGPVGDAIMAIAAEQPATVRVEVPLGADVLLFRPFELGLLFDASPAALDVSLVFDLRQGSEPPSKQPPQGTLRMLALFSMPTDQAALNVRRERHELRELVQRVIHTSKRSVELRVLQYGVTRELLADVLAEGQGWDVIHFSGHGLPAGLVLEHEDGTADTVHSTEFVELLWSVREQLKLVVLSSCESGATTAAHAMELLGLRPDDVPPNGDGDEAPPGEPPLPAVAQRLAADLGCAALAMRYPVNDQFAVEFAGNLYEGLLAYEQPLTRALQRTLRKAAPAGQDPSRPSLSLATPALFGSAALDLVLQAPLGEPARLDPSDSKLAYFEPEPKNFVGRVGPLAAASGALAPKSEHRGVLFHGMAGAGKTACALELVYRHESRRFEAMAWHRAPSEERDIRSSLAKFAIALEAQLPGFVLAHVIDDAEKLKEFAPRLRQIFADNSLLVVLDNVESLLTDDGQWRDPRWAMVVEAMVEHDGLSRLVLTSRVPPAGLRDDPRVRVIPISSLSARESVLLARQMPNLGQLMLTGGGLSPAEGRDLVRRALEAAQGNPKLIELADRQAADAPALRERLDEADEAWAGSASLETFFATGEPDDEIGAGDFLRVIERWTDGITATLADEERFAFQVICCLEPNDRTEAIVGLCWKHLMERLDREPPARDLESIISATVRHGLIDPEPLTTTRRLSVHPAIERVGRQAAGERLREAIDAELATAWRATCKHAIEKDDTRSAVYASLSAAPYLLRLGEFELAAFLLRISVENDPSPQTLATALPYLERASTQAAGTPAEQGVRRALLKARALLQFDDVVPDLREQLARAREEGDSKAVGTVAIDLFSELIISGRLKEAEDLLDDLDGATGEKPGDMLEKAMRLRLMQARGKNAEVLEEVKRIHADLAPTVEEKDGEDGEGPSPFSTNIEAVLEVGGTAAKALEEWDQALALNATLLRNRQVRAAPMVQQAMTAFNDYYPLLELERLDTAERVLRRVRPIIDAEGDPRLLGLLFSAWGDLEGRRGNLDEAAAFERRALRFKYMLGQPESINVSHTNLAVTLTMIDGDATEAIGHRMAAALISYQSGSGEYDRDLRTLAATMARFGPDKAPRSFDELCACFDKFEGVDFGEFFERLAEGTRSGEEALVAVMADVQRFGLEDEGDAAPEPAAEPG